MTMHRSTLVRSVSVVVAIVLGSTLAFVIGVRAGSQLDHRTHAISVVPAPVHVTVAHR